MRKRKIDINHLIKDSFKGFFDYDYLTKIKYYGGDLDKAIQDCSQMIARCPDDSCSYSERADVYYLKGDIEKALDDLKKADELDPEKDNGQIYLLRAYIYFELGQYLKAAKNWSVVIDYTYDCEGDIDTHALIFRGVCYRRAGKYDLAIRDFDEAIREYPNDAVYYNNRGNAHLCKGEIEKAIEDYNTALEIDPGLVEARINLRIANALKAGLIK